MSESGPDASHDSDLAVLRDNPELARTFFSETFDSLNSIEARVLAYEAAPDEEALNDLFRPFHTLKANAGALALARVETLAHRVESLLDRARSGSQRIGDTEVEVILAAVDLLTLMIRDVEARLAGRQPVAFGWRHQALFDAINRTHDPAPGEAAPVPSDLERELPQPAEPVRTGPALDTQSQAAVKVDTVKLDSVVDLVGELTIVQTMIRQDSELQRLTEGRLARNLAQLHRITGELQRVSISTRLVPIQQTFQRMSRLVRDLSQKSGKGIELVVSGEDTELDRKVVEEIRDPLMHMIRNSVDHGIEDVETRQRAGKPAHGRLSLSAYHKGGSVVIEVADDGRGLDVEKLRQKAASQKIFDEGATVSEAELYALIFRPGFSTAADVTEMSGRGVGMDVVRRNIETLRGRIDIRNRPGQGATFVIKLPLTLATVEGIILGVGQERFVLPTFAVCESLRPSGDVIHYVAGQGWMIRVRDEVLPLARLSELLGIAGGNPDYADGVVVVLEDDMHRLAVVVDRLLGKQDIVIKSLGEALVNVQGVAGAAILADGRISLILDAGGLFQLHRRIASRAA